MTHIRRYVHALNMLIFCCGTVYSATSHIQHCASNKSNPRSMLLLPFSSAVPSIVESLTGIGFATRIELSWTPPTKLNGIITGYFLTYSTGSGELSSENIPASVTNYTVTGLEENMLYQLTVSAETGAGRGEGSTVSVRTLPDGGSCSMQLRVCAYVCG